MNLLDYDWREKVASMTEADDQDIEKAFSDMASGFVTNRVGDLMKDEHRIGFEIVKKNDDNTRMLGVFAFKVDKDLIFAPVFFLSGEIKGPLLYRCDNKRFVPANKDWASYLIEHMDDPEGRPISRSKSRQSESRVQMDRLLEHPTKEASIREAVVEEFGQDPYKGMAEAILKQANTKILKEFLCEPDVGEPAARLIEKVASMDNSDEFVLRLAQSYGSPENFLPEKFTYTEKEAAADPGRLELVYEFDKQAAANADQYWKDGFYLFDNRYLKDTCKVYIQDADNDSLDSVTEAGVYDILKDDGEFERGCMCLHLNNREYKVLTPPYLKHNDKNLIVIIKDGKLTSVTSALGIRRNDLDRNIVGDTTVNEGNAYIAYIPGHDTLIGAYHIVNKKTVDGVTYCKVSKFYRSDFCEDHYYVDNYKTGREDQIIINPDVEKSDAEKQVFGKDARFIRLNSKLSQRYSTNSQRWTLDLLEGISDEHRHDVWLYDKFKLPTLSITFNKSASYPYQIHDQLEDIASEGLTRKEILIKLASDLKLPASTAYELTDIAERNGKVNFLYDGMDKLATRIRIVGRPDWREGQMTDSGLPKQEDQRFVLNIAGDQVSHEVPHIGDALNPTTATGLPNLTVVSTDPEQLRGLADTYQLPNVFEHGMVGTLADTFDANRLMDKYLPKLHEALDAIGRTLFLFYWKPDDFERQYGQDDMSNLEAQLESEFESFGALTLNLSKKNDKQKAVIVESGDIGI